MKNLINIDLGRLIDEIAQIASTVEAGERQYTPLIEAVHPENRNSARNLVHYLSLRTFDIRKLQEQLASLSISSIAHSEGYSLSNLHNILRILYAFQGESFDPVRHEFEVPSPFTYEGSKAQLAKNTSLLFGSMEPGGNRTRIMVTLPTEAATDYGLVKDLVEAGMDLARLNTSHDQPAVWRQMIQNIRRAEKETGQQCLVYMDLSGPKLRTDIERGMALRMDRVARKGGIKVYAGDCLQMVRNPEKMQVSLVNPEHIVAVIATSLPELFDDLQAGDRIFFDDGKIGGKITRCNSEEALVEITHAGLDGATLRHEKGINLPTTHLSISSLTEVDCAHLPFIAEYADVVGYSFVRRPEDVRQLQDKLEGLGRKDIGLVLKIETREAFDNLPALLLTAMRNRKAGVMIARGDLAVEIGFERMAEVQEEILWISEAAHMPNIWATQVLENLAKSGLATRGEITDAAMACRAECVMLNKGPYIVDAVRTLGDILYRMEKHQEKKHGSMRPLGVARQFFTAGTPDAFVPA